METAVNYIAIGLFFKGTHYYAFLVLLCIMYEDGTKQLT